MATRQRYFGSHGSGWDCDGVYQFAEGPRDSGSNDATARRPTERECGRDEKNRSGALSIKPRSNFAVRSYRLWKWKLQRSGEMIEDLLTGFVWSANFGILAYLFVGLVKAFS